MLGKGRIAVYGALAGLLVCTVAGCGWFGAAPVADSPDTPAAREAPPQAPETGVPPDGGAVQQAPTPEGPGPEAVAASPEETTPTDAPEESASLGGLPAKPSAKPSNDKEREGARSEEDVEEEVEGEEEEPAYATISPETIGRIQEGMPVEQVEAVLGIAGQTVARQDVDNLVLRWSDASGNSVIAKFQDGRLVRKSIYSADGSPLQGESTQQAISREDYDAVAAGMTVEEVSTLLGVPSRQVTSDTAQVVLYAWKDSTGSSFTAKFEDGRLVQKSGFYLAPLGEVRAEAEPAEAEAYPEDELEPEGEMEGSGRAAPRRMRPRPAQEQVPVEAAPPEPAPAPQVASHAPPSRVRVVGGSRRQQEGSAESGRQGSYNPRAKLPDFTWTLRNGAYEVQLVNTTNATVRAGLRTGAGGKDVTVPPGATRALRVDRDNYVLYYIFSDDPDTLHQGGGINLDGVYVADVRITLFSESHDVEAIDHSREFFEEMRR